jgi:DNA-binding LytR/AlgR family response regulator
VDRQNTRLPPRDPPALDRISLRVEREYLILPVRAILYARRDNGVTTVQLEDQALKIRLSLDRLEGLLEPHGFLRSHRAFLVNLRRVSRIVPWSQDAASLLLDDGKETLVPLAKSRRRALKSTFLWP